MASKLELLQIRGNRLQGMMDDIHQDEDCQQNLKLYWGVYCCEHCKHLEVRMHEEVYLPSPLIFKMFVNVDWLIRDYIIYPINDVFYWVSAKLTLKKTEPKGNQND